MAKDFFGNEIKIGDEVAFMRTKYRYLLKGKVIKITEYTVLIEHKPTNTLKTETRQEHSQVIVNPKLLKIN